jgi:hypothetical protein
LFDDSKLWQKPRIFKHFQDEADKLTRRLDNPEPDYFISHILLLLHIVSFPDFGSAALQSFPPDSYVSETHILASDVRRAF